jgi:hypothetical protein
VDRERLTQVGRALDRLGIEHIAAYSPEARGRSERMFGTLQDRLIKELAKSGITEIAAANAWIRDVYLPAHNARFARAAAVAESAFVKVETHTAQGFLLKLSGSRHRKLKRGPRASRPSFYLSSISEMQCGRDTTANPFGNSTIRQGAGKRVIISRARASVPTADDQLDSPSL